MNVSNYARMFPQLMALPSVPGSAYEVGLAELGKLMVDEGEQERGTVTAGYTYLGQFIDHDLTLDITPLPLAHRHSQKIRNFRTPYLDLDHVYAGGPNVSPFLYEHHGPRGNERFLIGQTENGDKAGTPNDLPRNSLGVALVGDPRQDENLIIAQLHVAFLKFHNRVMDELEKLANGKPSAVENAGPVGATRFEQAQRIVTWSYQYIVLHDFLAELLDKDVSERLEHEWSMVPSNPRKFQIPLEFSLAAFRFGHSMVRDVYNAFNEDQEDVDLLCLLALTGMGNGRVPCSTAPQAAVFQLPETWVIQWRHFFMTRPTKPQLNESRRINTAIAKRLHELPAIIVKLFSAPTRDQAQGLRAEEHLLPVRTLWRGARSGLPSGQDVARAFGIDPLDSDSQIATGPHADLLREFGFHRKTPLWYYILKEAELDGKGVRLGHVGSRIVGETIVAALSADPDSYLGVRPAWEPVLGGKRASTMSDILTFVGLLTP
jgi:hypothetical protein